MINKFIKYNNTKFFYRGNPDLLNKNPIAFFCSRKISISLYLSAIPFLEKLFELPLVIAGGWHSPAEKRMFKYVKKENKTNIIIFPGKSIDSYKIDYKISNFLNQEKYLIISPFKCDRISRKSSLKRNRLLLDFCNRIFFLSIYPGGNLDKILELSLKVNREIYIYNHVHNKNYFQFCKNIIDIGNIGELIDGT